ncbi:MAG TPA: hypothetical protein VL173_07165 [Vicinamibacterales bacterium]|nr:hypothetical protein [Vicinamibacterales bacterium]
MTGTAIRAMTPLAGRRFVIAPVALPRFWLPLALAARRMRHLVAMRPLVIRPGLRPGGFATLIAECAALAANVCTRSTRRLVPMRRCPAAPAMPGIRRRLRLPVLSALIPPALVRLCPMIQVFPSLAGLVIAIRPVAPIVRCRELAQKFFLLETLVAILLRVLELLSRIAMFAARPPVASASVPAPAILPVIPVVGPLSTGPASVGGRARLFG